MITMLSIKKSSYLMQDYEKDIIITLLQNYFKNYIKDGNGSYLATFDFNKIDFYWCKNFFYENEGNIIGAWNPMYKNSIFIKPSLYNQKFYDDFKNQSFFNKLNLKEVSENETKIRILNNLDEYELTSAQKYYIKIWNDYCNTKILYNKTQLNNYCIMDRKICVKDFNKYKFINYLFQDIVGSIMSTILHELYHKYQFEASIISKISYIFNYFVSLFLGYDNASKMKWTIEGNVRYVIDNESTSQLINKFAQIPIYLSDFYSIYLRDKKQNRDVDNSNIASIKELLSTPEGKILYKIYKKYNILQDNMIAILDNILK